MTDQVLITKSVYASVAHRYWNSQWSEAENQKIYGRDASREGIGSNLQLILSAVEGHEAGLSATLAELKGKVDHQCLFAKDNAFEAFPSTLENIAMWLAGEADGEWHWLTLWETERLGCRVQRASDLVTMIFKRSNLTLEIAAPINNKTGIAVVRTAVDLALEAVLVKLNNDNDQDLSRWSEKLFSTLADCLNGLNRVRIDLGSHESLVVHS